MTLKQFKWVDLLLFSLVTVIFEVINHFASVNLSSFKVVFMSFTVVLTLISIYRWGIAGLVVMAFASVIAVAISPHNGEYQHYLTYVIGGVLGMIPGYIIFQIMIGRKRIKHTFLIILYLVFDFTMVILVRSLFFYMLKVSDFVTSLSALFVQESMSIATSIIILLIANRKKGNIVVEMNNYVHEVKEEKKLGNLKEVKENPNFNSDSSFTEFNQMDEANILDGGTLDVDQLKELEKMYKDYGRITEGNPTDCLTKQEEDKKNV